jgi:tetratricopeptide (TPR) repeat protein
MPDIVVRTQGAGAARPTSAAELKARAELQALFTAAEAAVTAGNYDDAITKLNEVAGKTQACAECFVRIGEIHLKKSDAAAAEASFLKAAEVNANSAAAYDALANLYNSQRKFEEAVAMSTKANAARAAGGGAAGGGDATALFNAGVIFWNQGKIAEAREQFQKAVDADPKMAEAHYQLGMTLLNENKQPEAKAALQKYLELAPTGQNAETAKAILGSLK